MEVSKSKLVFALAITGLILLISLPSIASESNDKNTAVETEEKSSITDIAFGEEEELPIEDQNSATIINQETGDFLEDEDTSIEE
jgi:hypothetical protein